MRPHSIILLFITAEIQCFISKHIRNAYSEKYGFHNKQAANKNDEKVIKMQINEKYAFEKINTLTTTTITEDPETDDTILYEDYVDDMDIDNKEPVEIYNRDDPTMEIYYRGRQKINKHNSVTVEDIETDKTKDISKARLKRSSNYIEEENLGSTVAGFKFTGKPTHLQHNLAFNNINS